VDRQVYRGRFAPSPTGPLHLGSLLAALASFLDARAHGGVWLVRIEDIDPPREMPGADRRILDTLRAHALEWDEPVLYQSSRTAAYREAVDRLMHAGLAFACSCSRQELQVSGGAHADHCPATGATADRPTAVRVPCGRLPAVYEDLLLGPVDWSSIDRRGSFVVRRRDGLAAYHLAVVVDDAHQHISHVIRGRDLLDSTPYHLLLQDLLGLPSPHYGHAPLLLGGDGQKLSKQNLALPVDDARAADNLRLCLRALGQHAPPPGLAGACAGLLKWATRHWDLALIPVHDTKLD
jgi:glutamyl-Q tRNA(Asp) synthetase